MRLNNEQIKLLKNGNVLKLNAIYKKISNRFCRFVSRFINRKKVNEEIIQGVCIKTWETRSKIDVKASVESYLFAITSNATVNQLQEIVNEAKYDDSNKSVQFKNEVNMINKSLRYEQISQKCKKLFQQLKFRQKDFFILNRYTGLSHKEISQKLDISADRVKNHFAGALNFL